METISKGKVALIYFLALAVDIMLGLVFASSVELFTGPTFSGGGFGDIGPSLQQMRWFGGSIVGFFFCLSFAQLAFVHSYWKLFWPVLVVAILLALITGLIWFALAYAVVGALAGWLWRRWRRP